MLRGYRYVILAAFLGLAAPTAILAQATNGNKVEQKASGGAPGKEQPAQRSAAAGAISDGEEANQADCGTPKECRAEQREKDDLIAQQKAAEAAEAQATLSRWQTFIATVGVIAVIATLIYTHMATRAAVGAVNIMQAADRPRIALSVGQGMFMPTANGLTFNMQLSNSGRTAATLKEHAVSIQSSPMFKDFKPFKVQRHNTMIAPGSACPVDEVHIPIYFGNNLHVAGYYEWETVFDPKRYRDYFCSSISSDGQMKREDAMGSDWPPDSV